MDVTASDIRKLIDRPATPEPVTSIYLNTDGARYARAADYEARLEALLRDARQQAERLDDVGRKGVQADTEAIMRYVRNEFERGDVRGLALFSSGGEIFDTAQTALGFRNIARVNSRPYVVPLEAMLGRAHHIALVHIERDNARLFRHRLGRSEEWFEVVSDVHGQHKQGGWSALRYQKNIEHEMLHHFKGAAEILRKAHEEEPFDAVVISGPHAEAVEFSRQLHAYLQKIVHGEPRSLASDAGKEEIKALLSEVEQELVSGRRSELLQRLAAGQGQAEKVARGLRHVLEAVNGKRVEVLFVVEGAGQPGYRASTGALALHEVEAEAYGAPVEPVDDLIDEIIEECVRMDATIELFRDEVRLDGHPVAALLRF